MRISSVGDAELIMAIYDGLFEAEHWARFLSLFRAQTGAFSAGIFVQTSGAASFTAHESGASIPVFVANITHLRYRMGDAGRTEMREGRVYSDHELIAYEYQPDKVTADPNEDASKDAVLDCFVRSIRVSITDGTSIWLTVASEQDFSAVTSAMMIRLSPHLRTALRCMAKIEGVQHRAAISEAIFERLNFGWLAVGKDGEVIESSHGVQAILKQEHITSRHDLPGDTARPVPGMRTVDARVSKLLKAFIAEGEPQQEVFNLSRDPLVNISINNVHDWGVQLGENVAAIAYTSGDRYSEADYSKQIVELFALSPSEARLAWSLAQGMTILEAAQKMSITIETARNYSKKIYSKTGTRGQADLVRLLLTSLVVVA